MFIDTVAGHRIRIADIRSYRHGRDASGDVLIAEVAGGQVRIPAYLEVLINRVSSTTIPAQPGTFALEVIHQAGSPTLINRTPVIAWIILPDGMSIPVTGQGAKEDTAVEMPDGTIEHFGFATWDTIQEFKNHHEIVDGVIEVPPGTVIA